MDNAVKQPAKIFEDLEYFVDLNEYEVESSNQIRNLADKLDSFIESLNNPMSVRLSAQKTINEKMKAQSVNTWFDLNPETLTANEVLFILAYPFYSRFGNGSWEARFAMKGDFGKWLTIYKAKLEGCNAIIQGV